MEIRKVFRNDKDEVHVTFRYYRREDYKDFEQCISEFYGKSYPHGQYLLKEHLEEMIAQQKLLIICGITDEGEMVSVSGADFDSGFGTSALLTLRVVKKRFRRMGIGEFQENILLAEIEKIRGISSIYVELMQNNGSSQNALEQKGFVNVGLRLAQYGDYSLLKALQTNTQYRTSAVVMCRNQSVKEAGILYCMEEVSSFVKHMYQELQVKAEITDERMEIQNMSSDIRIQESQPDRSINLFINAIGSSFDTMIADILSTYENSTFICFLNMKDKAACYAYERLKKCGFFFTGIKPLNGDTEYMILACVDEKRINIDDFTPNSPGKCMLDAILQMRGERR